MFIFVWSRVGAEPRYTVRAQYVFIEKSYKLLWRAGWAWDSTETGDS